MDEIKILPDLLHQYAARYPGKGMLHAKIGSEWESHRSEDVLQRSQSLANGILALGINGADYTPENQGKVAIISNNRPEWVIADFATQMTGAVLVPLYPSITEAEWEFILNESKVKLVFISDKTIYKKLKRVLDRIPSLTHVYSFDKMEEVAHWTELLKEASASELDLIKSICAELRPEYLATIIYTSGTTGNPKGVMLSHNNIASNVRSCMECFDFCDSSERVLSFLPLNHIFERTVLYVYICKGISIYFAQGMETIGPNLKEVKPVVFTTVPRLLEKVYEKIVDKGGELRGYKKWIFNWAMSLALRFELGAQSPLYSMQLKIADALVYSKWRAAVGGDIKAIVTGSAACQVKLLRIFTAAKIVVMEGYGLTETSPVVSVNRYQVVNRKFGTVGTVIQDVEVKIADDGEILCKGPNIMMGYYKHPVETAEAIRDDWFYTGDIGTIVEGKFLKITDRKKEIFKISGGKYIAPLPIENKMKESPFIEQIMVVGHNEKFAGALIVPALDKIRTHLGLQDPDRQALLQNKEVLRLLRNELDKNNPLFSSHEQVKKFELIPDEWTIEGGELTATMKLKRKNIMAKYGHLVEQIYR